jgi:hypothetical protein
MHHFYCFSSICNGLAGMGILATIGVANLFFFVIIVHVFAIDNPIVIWTLIVIEFSYYSGIFVCASAHPSTSTLIFDVMNQ